MEKYLGDLLDSSIPRNKKFINDVLRKWRPPPKKIDLPADVQVHSSQILNLCGECERSSLFTVLYQDLFFSV